MANKLSAPERDEIRRLYEQLAELEDPFVSTNIVDRVVQTVKALRRVLDLLDRVVS